MSELLKPSSGWQKVVLRGGYVITCDPQLGDLPRGDVVVDGGRIVSVGRDLEAPDAHVVDVSGRIVMPGFVDSHRHLWEGVLRNALPDSDLADYFSQVIGQFGPCFEPEDVYVSNLLSALGAINAGVTTVLDWSHISNTPAHSDAAIQALVDSKIRAVFALGPPSRGIVPWYEDTAHAYPEDLHRLRKGALSSDDARVTLALAALGPEFVGDEPAMREWRTADALGLRITVHVGVGQAGMASRVEQFGRSYGLNDRTTYIHCCTLSDTEWKMIADSGGSVSLSPQIDMQMGQGVPPIDKALAFGLQPSLSVDVETSVPADMFTQMRSAFAIQRGLALQAAMDGRGAPPRLLTAADLVRFATVEGARANGLDRTTGSLTPGKRADLQVLRTDLINVMPLNDPYGAIVCGMDASNIETVMIDGEFVKWDGALVGVDMASLQQRVDAARDRIFTRRADRSASRHFLHSVQ